MTTTSEPLITSIPAETEPLKRMPAIISLGSRAVAACARIIREPASNKVSKAMVISTRASARVYAEAVRNSIETE